MSKRERFRLLDAIVGEVEDEDSPWEWSRKNMLLAEFGLPGLDGDFHGPDFSELITGQSDTDLVEMFSVVKNVALAEIETDVELANTAGGWKRGYVRVFLSHIAEQKAFAAEVSTELAVVGIHAFVAHDTIRPTTPWQTEIETALRSMQAFVGLLHPGFKDSAWCQQELGWALGRRVPALAIRLGGDAQGFISQTQWPDHSDANPKVVSKGISEWIASLPQLGSTVFSGLLSALEDAGNFVSAGAAAKRVASLGSLTEEQFSQLDRVWWSNDQLYGGALATRAMAPLYRANGRSWPPIRPVKDEGVSESVVDDAEPF